MRLGWTEILVVLGVILIFFGGKRLPDLGRSLGKALRGFKDGVDGKDPEGTASASAAASASPEDSLTAPALSHQSQDAAQQPPTPSPSSSSAEQQPPPNS